MTDKKIEGIVGNLLRAGVLLSAFVVVCGAVLYLVQEGGSPADYATFHAAPAELRNVSGILRGAAELHSVAIIQLGLLLLIATPVARVAFCVIGFAAERDRMYVAFTLVVLVILIFSLTTGRA
jgi:uncharacterized membrane protein